MKEALSNRNAEFKLAEHNNNELLTLLDNYDVKLDELNEQNEFKDLQLVDLYQKHDIELPKISLDTLE